MSRSDSKEFDGEMGQSFVRVVVHVVGESLLSVRKLLGDAGGDDEVTMTECPFCHRLFCAQCKVTWHEGIGCKEFQRVGKTKKKCRVILNGILNIAKRKEKKKNVDKLLIQLAKKKQWRRCPSCNFYVEKLVGCMHISCR
ncbi:hypothetical protein F2Q70_00023761 [Brassica cretica]|uniref:RBR-type E3 ubiquitin transferase n=1 Tax=Brassica cretica TaxID=69181 RepID=A0A8S9GPE2_BRACR|nr:hypothetical protein F2Q70_00023761 [Brassica cretica]